MKSVRGFIEIPIIVIVILITGVAITAYSVSRRSNLLPKEAATQEKDATSLNKVATPSGTLEKSDKKIDSKSENFNTPLFKNTFAPSPTPTTTQNPSQSSVKLDSISPNPTKSGDTITLKGSGFGSSGQYVIFTNPQGFTSGAGIISWSDTEIKAYVPPTKGENKVQVEGSTGVKSNVYTLQVTSGQPYFASIGPSNVKPGGEITVNGDEFGDSKGEINFYKPDNISSASGGSVIYSWTNTEIKANVPGILAPNQEYGIQVVTADGRKSSFKYYQVGN